MSRSNLAWNLAYVAACLALAGPARASTAVSQEAQEHFNAGVRLLQDPHGARYEEAYRELKAAYAASPSWKILGSLGTCAMKLERDGEAIDALRKYLAEGGGEIEAEERAQVQRDLSTLEGNTAQLSLTLPEGATLLDERFPAAGAPVQNSYGPGPQLRIGVHPGRHRLTAQREGKSETWEVQLEPKASQQHVFNLQADAVAAPAKAPSSPGLRTLSYVAFGVGAVGIGVGTYFGLKAWDRYDQGNSLCPATGACTLTSAEAARRAQLGKDGDSAKTVSLIGVVAGSVGVAVGITLFVLSDGRGATEKGRVSAYVGPAQLGLKGSF